MSYIVGRLAGILVGVLVGLAICFIAFKRMNSNGKLKTDYDERQSVIRDKGFKYGFWTISGYLFLLILFESAEIELPVHNVVLYFTGFFVGAMVSIVYSIWKGAYFGLNSKRKSWVIFIGFFGVFNILIGIASLANNGLIVDGKVGINFINILCGIMLLIADATFGLRILADKKEDDYEESEA